MGDTDEWFFEVALPIVDEIAVADVLIVVANSLKIVDVVSKTGDAVEFALRLVGVASCNAGLFDLLVPEYEETSPFFTTEDLANVCCVVDSEKLVLLM